MDGDDLLTSPDPAVSYCAHRRLAGATEDDPDRQRRRRWSREATTWASSPVASAFVEHRDDKW